MSLTIASARGLERRRPDREMHATGEQWVHGSDAWGDPHPCSHGIEPAAASWLALSDTGRLQSALRAGETAALLADQ